MQKLSTFYALDIPYRTKIWRSSFVHAKASYNVVHETGQSIFDCNSGYS